MISKQKKDILPQHVAIIMDGNRRWAQNKGLSDTAGHRAGSENLEKIIHYCHQIGIKHLTVYALSTENIRHRSISEIKGIFQLIAASPQLKFEQKL